MSDNQYDVKRILDCRRRGSRTQYLVRWADSWVYREDLCKGCDQLIHEFQVSKQTTDGRTVQQSGAEENVDTEDKENLEETEQTEEESDLIIADIEPKDEDTAAPKDQKREEDSGLDIADIGLDTESEVQSEVNDTDEWKPDDEVSDSVEETADSADEYNPKKKKKKTSAKTKPKNEKKKGKAEDKPKPKVTKKKPKVTTELANKSAADSGSAATSSVDLKSKPKKKKTFVPPLKSK